VRTISFYLNQLSNLAPRPSRQQSNSIQLLMSVELKMHIFYLLSDGAHDIFDISHLAASCWLLVVTQVRHDSPYATGCACKSRALHNFAAATPGRLLSDLRNANCTGALTCWPDAVRLSTSPASIASANFIGCISELDSPQQDF
jgi:hypothetical protein